MFCLENRRVNCAWVRAHTHHCTCCSSCSFSGHPFANAPNHWDSGPMGPASAPGYPSSAPPVNCLDSVLAAYRERGGKVFASRRIMVQPYSRGIDLRASSVSSVLHAKEVPLPAHQDRGNSTTIHRTHHFLSTAPTSPTRRARGCFQDPVLLTSTFGTTLPRPDCEVSINS